MISAWILVLALFFTVGVAGLYVVGYKILTVMEILNRHIQWGSPQIRERRPVVTGSSSARHTNGD
jgi:hypothetical protein